MTSDELRQVDTELRATRRNIDNEIRFVTAAVELSATFHVEITKRAGRTQVCIGDRKEGSS